MGLSCFLLDIAISQTAVSLKSTFKCMPDHAQTLQIHLQTKVTVGHGVFFLFHNLSIFHVFDSNFNNVRLVHWFAIKSTHTSVTTTVQQLLSFPVHTLRKGLKALLCVRTAGRHVPLSEHFVILAYVRRRVSKFTWNGNTEVPRSPLCWFPVTPGLRLATFLATEVLMKFTKDRGRLYANVTKAR